MNLQTQDFLGAVSLKHWMPGVDGQSYNVIVGRCSLLTKDDFDVKELHSNETSWAIYVQGETEAMTILGCQVMTVHDFSHPLDHDHLGKNVLVVS